MPTKKIEIIFDPKKKKTDELHIILKQIQKKDSSVFPSSAAFSLIIDSVESGGRILRINLPKKEEKLAIVKQ